MQISYIESTNDAFCMGLRYFRYEKIVMLLFGPSFAIISANEKKKSIFNGWI